MGVAMVSEEVVSHTSYSFPPQTVKNQRLPPLLLNSVASQRSLWWEIICSGPGPRTGPGGTGMGGVICASP